MRLIVKTQMEFVNIEADELKEDACYIRAYDNGRLVGTFLESDISMAYLSGKNDEKSV